MILPGVFDKDPSRIESSGLYNHFDMESLSLVGIEEIWEYVQYVGMRNMCRWFLKIFVS